ncbi:MAG: DUF2007 domain-containing protein [Bacteroidales bacterium]|nr:DUF2007 domain-containing protein [Bacteroidales bacterium]
METQYYKVFTGQAIDVKMVKNFLQKHNIKSFAENRNEVNSNEWNEPTNFDPYMELMVAATDLEKSVKLVDEFMNSRAK